MSTPEKNILHQIVQQRLGEGKQSFEEYAKGHEPAKGGITIPAGAAPGPLDDMPEKLKAVGKFAISMMDIPGMMIDAFDLGKAVRERDLVGGGLALAGLALPIASGKSLKTILDSSVEARRARAAEQGYIDAWHGTRRQMDQITNLDKGTSFPVEMTQFPATRKSHDPFSRLGVHVAVEPTDAERVLSPKFGHDPREVASRFAMPDEWGKIAPGEAAGTNYNPNPGPGRVFPLKIRGKLRDIGSENTAHYEMYSAPLEGEMAQEALWAFSHEKAGKVTDLIDEYNKFGSPRSLLAVQEAIPGMTENQVKYIANLAATSRGNSSKAMQGILRDLYRTNPDFRLAANTDYDNMYMTFSDSFKAKTRPGEVLSDAYKKKLLDEGYSGLRYRNEIEGGMAAVIFDPKYIRSTSAMFDPEKLESANLLAGGAGIAAVGLGASKAKKKEGGA